MKNALLRTIFVALAALAPLAVLAAAPASAVAAAPSPGFTIHSFALPTSFSSSDNTTPGCAGEVKAAICDSYQVTATDTGDGETNGTPVVLKDTVPAGLTVQRVAFFWSGLQRTLGLPNTTDLSELGFCTSAPVQCELPFTLAPDDTLKMIVFVSAPSGSGTLTNAASVSGGGALEASTEAQNPFGGPSPSFGPAAFETYTAGLDGQPDTQAGDHPYEFSTRIDFNNIFRTQPDATFGAGSVQDPKDVAVDLPLGFLGSALATPTCTFAQLSSHISAGVGGCPKDTIVGHIVTEPVSGDSVEGPIYNMVAEKGVAAEFGFVDLLAGSHVLKASVVPTPAGYVLRTIASELPQVPLTDVIATFYGDPAAKDESGIAPVPLFTNPSSCDGQPLSTAVHVDSWLDPGRVGPEGEPELSDPNWVSRSASSPAISGCSKQRFSASFSLKPDTTVADSPSGVDVDIQVPQSEQIGTLGTPPLKKAVVTLPQGFTVDPSAAGGLGACSPSQIGLESAAAPSCPDDSKIGTVELTTPLLANTLVGSIYLATQYDNPFNSLLAGYIVVDDPETGVVVKIPGNLTPNPSTGQITGVFDNNPQFPFSDLKLHFKGGTRGALATPESCGTFTTLTDLTPWSAPDSGPDASPFDSFPINSGCVSGFAPSFIAGTSATHAGAYSPIVLSFSRSDTDQELSGLTVTLPPGLLAKVAGVALCSNAQLEATAANPSGASEAANSSCPAASQVGTVQAGAGPGPDPYFVSGKAYLTGPYKGAPYGLAVVIPALAGPFDLGNVVVRTSLAIDPTDGHVTATSDAFPTILHGIPIRLRRVEVSLDRPNFAFNPTSCEPMAINASLSSTTGSTAAASSRFQVGGCQELSFKPRLSASTEAKTSKANGAALTVKIAQSPGEADIRKVDVQLPLALPSRLTTLQKACLEAQFNANPANCPAASVVGSATAVTPVLETPLTGPAYLVSHGGAAFPDLEFVLQGSGVTIVLDGKTDIKKGITYSKFETVPDAPISSFSTVLPEGPHSILAANTNLCKPTKLVAIKKRVAVKRNGKTRHVTRTVKENVAAPLQMPTTITAQSGAQLTQTTSISVGGCAQAAVKPKVAKKAKKKGKGAKKK